jgi:uncharacterized protein (TIGR03435 family)
LRYDINATFPGGASKQQLQSMLRGLRETHWETRELSVYALLVGKNGPKIQSTARAENPVKDQLADVGRAERRDGFQEDAGYDRDEEWGARITAKDVSLKKLTGQAGCPVVDMRLRARKADVAHLVMMERRRCRRRIEGPYQHSGLAGGNAWRKRLPH